jgi:hypothetical protein
MPAASFFAAKTFANLKNLGEPGSQQPFHAQLRGGVQIPVARRLGIDIGLRGRGRYAIGSFHLQVAAVDKKLPDRLNDPGTQFKVFSYFSLAVDQFPST